MVTAKKIDIIVIVVLKGHSREKKKFGPSKPRVKLFGVKELIVTFPHNISIFEFLPHTPQNQFNVSCTPQPVECYSKCTMVFISIISNPISNEILIGKL